MGKVDNADQKKRIVELLKKNTTAAMSLSEIALLVRLPSQQVLTLLGQLKGEVECVSRATMESSVSMKWEDVDSRWRAVGGGSTKAPIKWPPRPGSAPFGSETAAQLKERLKKGKLTQDKLLLAAWLGHAGAREALGPKAPPETDDLTAWLLGLVRWNQPVRVRGLAAAASKALAAFGAARPEDERPKRAIEAALAFAKSPGDAAAQLATGTALGAEEAAKDAPEGPARGAATLAYRIGILVAAVSARKPAADLEGLAAEIAGGLAGHPPRARRAGGRPRRDRALGSHVAPVEELAAARARARCPTPALPRVERWLEVGRGCAAARAKWQRPALGVAVSQS